MDILTRSGSTLVGLLDDPSAHAGLAQVESVSFEVGGGTPQPMVDAGIKKFAQLFVQVLRVRSSLGKGGVVATAARVALQHIPTRIAKVQADHGVGLTPESNRMWTDNSLATTALRFRALKS